MKLYESFTKNLEDDTKLTEAEINKTYECPLCGKELNEIGVVSKATSTFNIESGEYSPIEDVEETVGYYCPKCGEELPFDTTDKFVASIENLHLRESCGKKKKDVKESCDKKDLKEWDDVWSLDGSDSVFEQCYCQPYDRTFIMKWDKEGNNGTRAEVTGWYQGQPDQSGLEAFKEKPIAHFDTPMAPAYTEEELETGLNEGCSKDKKKVIDESTIDAYYNKAN